MSGSLSRTRLYARSLTCARTDGRCVSSGGGDVHTRCPLARPFGGSPPTLAGALPALLSAYLGLAAPSLFMAVSKLSVCMCFILGLACIVLFCFHGCAAYVLCVLTRRRPRHTFLVHHAPISSPRLGLCVDRISSEALVAVATDRTHDTLVQRAALECARERLRRSCFQR